MTSQTEPLKIDGLTLMLRIGHAPRGRISYFSPQTTIEEFLRHAAEHEGRLLFVGNFKSLRNKIGFNYFAALVTPKRNQTRWNGDQFRRGIQSKNLESEIPLSGTIPMGKNACQLLVGVGQCAAIGRFRSGQVREIGLQRQKDIAGG